MIQRLVTSNPSPAYVSACRDVFADNGAGVRGDMKSVFAAVLLDNEARSPAGLADPNFGRLREPMLRFVQWARTFGADVDQRQLEDRRPRRSRRRARPEPAALAVGVQLLPARLRAAVDRASPPPSMVAPEFQLVNETSVGGYLNFMQSMMPNGIDSKDVERRPTRPRLALVLDPAGAGARGSTCC